MKRLLIIGILLATAFSATSQEKTPDIARLRKINPEFAVSVLFAEGVQKRLGGDFHEARRLFTEVLQINSNHAPSLYQLILMPDSDPASILSLAETAYNLDVTNTDYQAVYIENLIVNNQYHKASQVLNNLAAKGSLSSKNSYFRTAIMMYLGDIETFETLANEHLERWGYNPLIMDMLTDVLVTKRQIPEAEALLNEYIESNPSDPELKISLAKIKSSVFKDDEALALLKSAVELDSLNIKSHMALSDYYQAKEDVPNYLASLIPIFQSRTLNSSAKAGYFEQSFFDVPLLRKYYNEIEQLSLIMYGSDPYDPEIERVYIRFLTYTGDIANLKQLLVMKIETGRGNPDAYHKIIEIDNYTGNYKNALKYAKIGTDKYPDNPDFRIMKAVTYSLQKNTDDALNELHKAFAMTKNDSIRSAIKTFEGDIEYENGNYKKAFVSYKKALKYDPNNASLLNNFAYYMSLQNTKLDNALKMAQRANELSPNNSVFMDTEAWVLYKLGRYEEARQMQRKAVALSPSPEHSLLNHYGDILYKLGHDFLAETYWKKALEAGADAVEIETKLTQLK